ncbi:VOC family protein [Nocardiopsis oceani]
MGGDMITTDFVTGSPCWLELGASDVGAALDFYGNVFDWVPVSGGARTGNYQVMVSDGAFAAGVGTLFDEDELPEWTPFFWVPDLDAAVVRAHDLGGRVEVQPTDVFELGRLAHVTDPQGGWIALWQPGSFSSLQATDRPNSLCWMELWTSSAQGAKDFYAGLFGWEFSDVELSGGEGVYSMFRPAGLGDDRYCGGLMEMEPTQLPQTDGGADWHPVFQVTDCDLSAYTVKEAGGHVHMGPQNARGVGRMAVCSDPFSAAFVLLDPATGPG